MKRNICDMCKNCKDNDKSIPYCFDVCGAPIDILRLIEEQRNKSLNQTEWIPVSERLPENYKNVLVSTHRYDEQPFVYIGYYAAASQIWIIDNVGYEVDAWMPLPDPYEV